MTIAPCGKLDHHNLLHCTITPPAGLEVHREAGVDMGSHYFEGDYHVLVSKVPLNSGIEPDSNDSKAGKISRLRAIRSAFLKKETEPDSKPAGRTISKLRLAKS